MVRLTDIRDAGIVVNEIDNGNAIYGGVHYGIHFTR